MDFSQAVVDERPSRSLRVKSPQMVRIPPAPTGHLVLPSSDTFSPISSSVEQEHVHQIPVTVEQPSRPRDSDQKERVGLREPTREVQTSRSTLSLVLGGLSRDPPLFVRRRTTESEQGNEEEKAAAATALELAIMGSALVLTLCLQVQEVVGGRGGFDNITQATEAQYLFVGTSALSFAFGFYSIVTAAVMLQSIVSTPSIHTRPMLKKLSGWIHAPRLCTLAAAGCLGITTLIAFFLGIEKNVSILGAVVTGIGITLTAVATASILRLLADFDPKDAPCDTHPQQRVETVDKRDDKTDEDGVSASSKDPTHGSCTSAFIPEQEYLKRVGEEFGNATYRQACMKPFSEASRTATGTTAVHDK